MSKRGWLFGAAALAAWAAAFVLLRSSSPDVAGASDAAVASQPGPASRMSSVSERRAVESAASTESAAATLLVKVVHGATKLPVAGALVLAFENTGVDRVGDLETIARRRTKEALSDARGEARVPRLTRDGWVAAHKDVAYGRSHLTHGEVESVVVELAADTTARVRVLDDAGVPQRDVRVWLADWPPAAGAGGLRTNEMTDAQGVATFAHLAVGLLEVPSRIAPTSMIIARVQITGAEWPRSEPFAAIAPPADPVLVRLPPTGEVVMQVREGNSAITEPAQALLQWAEAPMRYDVEQTTAGRARFARVALGLHFSSWARRGPATTNRVGFDGPTRAGEIVTASVAFATDDPMLCGRAITRLQQVLAHRNVDVRIGAAGGEAARAATDANGSFRLLLSRELAGTTAPTLTFHCWRDTGPHEHFARVHVPTAIALGENMLGDVVFEEPPLVVGVQLVTPDGAPVSPPKIELRLRAGTRELFPSAHDVISRSLGEGRYEVRGYPPEGELALAVHAVDFRKPAPVAFVRGARDLCIVLERGAPLDVEVQLDPRITNLQGFLHRTDAVEPGGDPQWRSARMQGNQATLRWWELGPGIYDLALQAGGDPDPIATRTGVVVGAAGARLTLDLRNALHLFRIVAVDAAGNPIASFGGVRVLSSTGKKSAISNLTAGAVEIRSPKTALDAIVCVQDSKPVRITAAPGETRVTVTLGHRVRVRIEGLPPREVVATLWLESEQEPIPNDRWRQLNAFPPFAVAGTRAADEITFTVCQPGKHRLFVGSMDPTSPLLTLEPASITVLDRDDEQTFTVKVR